MAARVYWLWLATRRGITAQTAVPLLEHFGDPEAIYAASRGSLLVNSGLTAAQIDSLSDKSLDEADRIMEECVEKNIHIMTLGDSAYPERLRNIYDPPLVLYWYGKQPAWDTRPMISIVGSRSAASYGKMMANKFARSLTESGFLIVSGMADGVDGEANWSALRAGGSTIAVLGCGVDVCYPAKNHVLYGDLRLAGTLLSEYPPGAEPAGWHFPQRNRIISGLSVATIVISAPLRSGALITARQALDQGRDVYAVPSRLDDRGSEGCNALIRDHEADLLTDPLQLVYAYSSLLREEPDEKRIRQVFRGLTGYSADAAGPPSGQASRGENNGLQHAQRPETLRKSWPPGPAKPAESGTVRPENRPPEPIPAPVQAGTAVPEPPVQTGASGSAGEPADATLPEGLSEEERKILEGIRAGAQTTDQLISRTGLPAAQLLATVTMLELDGLICNEGGVLSLR